MARKKKELPLLEKVTITDVAAEGKALAKVNDLVVFVPYVVPGDVVDLQIKRKKNHYAEAVAVNFHEYSPKRAVPFCQHYGVCGGCKWQCLPYDEQIKYKQKQVTDNLVRIGKVELPEISPILGSAKTEFYRNKLEFTFSDKRWLTEEEVKADVKYDQMNAVGFHIPGAFDKVLAIEKCWLQDDISNQIRNAVRDYAYEHNYSFFNLRTQEGMLRNLMIRTSSTGELMVLLQCKITEPEASVTFSVEKKNRCVAEIMLRGANGTLFRAVCEDPDGDMRGAIDEATAQIERKIRKNKTRLAKNLRAEAVLPELPEEFEAHEEGTFDIVRTKRFTVKPMSVEEAILQMNLLGHSFFVFRNTDFGDAICVVYRRNNGGYGIIETEDDEE